MDPISSVNVFCGDGTTCYFDNITPLYSDCGKIIIPIGTYPHQVEVNPTAITIIPTRPTPTTTSCTTLQTATTTHYGRGDGNGNGHGNGDGHGHGGPGGHGGSYPTPPAYCKDPLIDIVVNLLGLNIDIAAYLDLSGLLEGVGELLSGLLGGGGRHGRPTSIKRRYEAHCGATLEHCRAGREINRTTSTGHEDCVSRCERAGIEASVRLGNLVDCLGVTLDRGISVDNCLFVLGDRKHLLDLDIDLLGGNDHTDSLINLDLNIG